MHVPRSSLHSWINKGVSLLHLASETLIAWPDARQCAMNAAQFRGVCDINGVIGAVDCSHIAITVPLRDFGQFCPHLLKA